MKKKQDITLIISEDEIKSKIYTIREQQVIFDRDLSEFYHVKTSRLNEQVKRNSKRFPSHYMFQLTLEEVEILRSQNAIANISPKSRVLPYVFTEFKDNKENSDLIFKKTIIFSKK